jgi:hypothetical protein
MVGLEWRKRHLRMVRSFWMEWPKWAVGILGRLRSKRVVGLERVVWRIWMVGLVRLDRILGDERIIRTVGYIWH